MSLHRKKTEAIAESVRGLANADNHRQYSLKKSVISHTVPQPGDPKNRDRKIDVGSLTEIIEIDRENRTAVAESGVTFERLVRETLRFGLVPKTVSELKAITIGGAVAGCSVESMSYRYGGFHDSCIEYEIVTGTGEIVTCSRDRDGELFEMIHGSFGTLGILTMLTFSLVPAEPFVRMQYRKYTSFEALLEAIRVHYEAQDLDFMDAIVHSPDECVLCEGTFVPEAPYTSRYVMKPFYRSTLERNEDYLAAYDYFFRYDADCHWIIRNYGLENPILRFLAKPFAVGSTNILTSAKRFPFLNGSRERPDVVVDLFLPYRSSPEFFRWYDGLFGHYPLWVVPYRIERMYPWVNPDLAFSPESPEDRLFIDCAIYGFRQRNGVNYYRELEKKVYELGGIKTLITNNYYTEEEFWQSYNRDSYARVKRRSDPGNLFRDLYRKTNYR